MVPNSFGFLPHLPQVPNIAQVYLFFLQGD
ncbi:hypothetical protein NIES3804_24340 [Microcystis aeruginosa NIES-3804]|uniref:Uncharacterized protein n=1 Tax=Microcystis aeruginosa NIES-3804 TaxID=2517783 RepID=A0A6H9G6R6_MICAE|nr:hypothetical protein NIES3804_24340 [Microcystis aeruginosa NIES-3804]